MTVEKNEERVLDAVKHADLPATASDIAREIDLTLPTVSKYVQILAAGKKILVKRVGRIIMVCGVIE